MVLLPALALNSSQSPATCSPLRETHYHYDCCVCYYKCHWSQYSLRCPHFNYSTGAMELLRVTCSRAPAPQWALIGTSENSGVMMAQGVAAQGRYSKQFNDAAAAVTTSRTTAVVLRIPLVTSTIFRIASFFAASA